MDIPEVRDFAVAAHGDQTYGVGVPYVFHLDAVVSILREFSYEDPALVKVALLHDVVEDTATSLRDLQDFGIPEDIRDAVDFCTDEKGHNRKTRKALTYRKWRETIQWEGIKKSWVVWAIRVKLADRIANIRESKANNPGLLKMYQKEAQVFRDALYAPGVADPMWKEYQMEIL